MAACVVRLADQSDALDFVRVGCSVDHMVVFKRQWSARGALMVLACGLLSISFAISTHFVPQGSRQLITIEHQLRRVLLRAERESLRSSVTIQQARVRSHSPQDLGKVSPFPEIVVTHYRIPLVSHTLIKPRNLVFELSPVLNL